MTTLPLVIYLWAALSVGLTIVRLLPTQHIRTKTWIRVIAHWWMVPLIWFLESKPKNKIKVEWHECFSTLPHALQDIKTVIMLGNAEANNTCFMIWIEQRTHSDMLWRWVIPNLPNAYGDCKTLQEAKTVSEEALNNVFNN